MRLLKILNAVSSSLLPIEVRESTRECYLKYRMTNIEISTDILKRSLDLIGARDRFELSFSPDGSDMSFALNDKADASVVEFAGCLKVYRQANRDVNGVLLLRISKVCVQRVLSVYSLDLLAGYLKSGVPAQILEKVSSLSKDAYYLECEELTETFKTDLLVFGPSLTSSTPPTNPENPKKQKILELRNKSCTIYSNVLTDYIPSDFRFYTPIPIKDLAELFKRIELVYSLIFIADISRVEGAGGLQFTVKGYSTVKLEVLKLESVDTLSADLYYEIFQWAYTGGNIVDKLGICRNLISIHSINDNLLALKDGCLEAIASNHVIYLKDNLKQYIDVKNKLSEQIQKGSEKAAEVAKTINAYLRTSIFSLFSFIFSVFLIRTIGKAADAGIVTSGIYGLFILLIVISVLVLIYATVETNAELKRYKKSYSSFQSRYSDLLSSEDLARIFSHDEDYHRDLAYIRNARKKAICLWSASLVVIFFGVTIMKYKGF